MITGAQAMVQALLQEGVTTIFGYPGAAIAPFYDSIAGSDIRHILTRTEQGAGHAASGYARLNGKPGVCVVTSGPGATNLFTAIATAYSDSIPLVAITGQVATHQLGRDVFQEVDTTGAVEPFTKYTYLVKHANDLARVFKEAFHIASTGRPGPVLIDIPVDVQEQLVDFHWPNQLHLRGYKPNIQGHARQVRKVAEALRQAKRPLLCCGGGVLLSGAESNVRQLCESANLPMVSTMMGIGILPPAHPLYYGMLGQSGISTANAALSNADLLVLIGARVGDRAISHPAFLESKTTIVHIDIDSAEIGKNLGTTIPLVGDANRVLDQLMAHDLTGSHADWLQYLDNLRKQEQLPQPKNSSTVNPHAFVRALCEHLPDDAIYVADVGQNQIWSARNYAANGRFLTTGGMGTMGYSIPAAIGAKLACPERLVLAVCGDGAFQMSMNELATANQHGIPLKLVVMTNRRLGMVREIQQHKYDGREFAVDLAGSPDIGMIAEAYGMRYFFAENDTEARQGVACLLQDDMPCLLECLVDPKEETK